MLELTRDNWRKEVELSSDVVVVELYAPRCEFCLRLLRIMDRIVPFFPREKNLKFGLVDTDDFQDVLVRYKIRMLPTLAIFKAGSLLFKVSSLSANDDKLFKQIGHVVELAIYGKNVYAGWKDVSVELDDEKESPR